MNNSYDTGRLILNQDLDSAAGLAIDEALCDSVGEKKSPPTLHLYNYVPSVIVGRFQNVAASLRLDRCEARNIQVNRRISGGGTVFMTPDQLALALVLPDDFPGLPTSINGAFQFLAKSFASALEQFGLKAEFMGKNDLTVNGKKIAGLAISRDHDNVTFFHTSLLLDFDIEVMLDILNLPTQRMLDRGISCFGQRMTTIREETGEDIQLPDLRDAVHRAIQNELGIPFPEESLADFEQERVKQLRKTHYDSDEWIYGVRSPKRRMTFAEGRTPGGLIQLHLCLSGGAIESVMITGDYFSKTRDVVKLESILKWTSAKRDAIEEKLNQHRAEEFIHRVDLQAISDLIQQAADRIRSQ